MEQRQGPSAAELVEWVNWTARSAATRLRNCQLETVARFRNDDGQPRPEALYPFDARRFVAEQHMDKAKRRQAMELLQQRTSAMPLVADLMYMVEWGETPEKSIFNSKVPLTLICEYKVPEGSPNAGRLMPIWLGSFEASQETALLIEHNVSAILCLKARGNSDSNLNAKFRALKSVSSFETLLSNANSEGHYRKDVLRLLEAPMEMSVCVLSLSVALSLSLSLSLSLPVSTLSLPGALRRAVPSEVRQWRGARLLLHVPAQKPALCGHAPPAVEQLQHVH